MTAPHANIYDLLPEQHPVVLAPLSGITDAAFREICRREGCRFVYAEMTSSEALVREVEKARGRIKGLDAPVPTVAQLLGNRPDVMADAAEMCVAMGADAVDVNLGCPAKQIVRGGGGSALMREPELVASLVRALVQRIAKPVSVKMRAGWDDNCRNAVEIARIAEAEGARAVAVHPRTRTQAFKGRANWEVIARVKESVSVPVIGNGDVKTPEDARRMLAETGCDAVMVGRAALGAPWLFRQMEHPDEFLEPSYESRIGVAVDHLRLLAQDKGDARAAIEFRKHLACYLKSMPESRFVRAEMARMDSVAVVVELLEQYRDEVLPKRLAAAGTGGRADDA